MSPHAAAPPVPAEPDTEESRAGEKSRAGERRAAGDGAEVRPPGRTAGGPVLEETGPVDAALAAILDRVEDRLAQGERPDFDVLCGDRPDLLDATRAHAAAFERRRAEFGATAVGPEVESSELTRQVPPPFDDRMPRSVEATVRFENFNPLPGGRGGLGVVYEADQAGLGRTLAVKFLQAKWINPGAGGGPEAEQQREAFEREAAVTAKLDHPGVPKVVAHGVDDGIPYYAMSLIRGQTLADLVADFHAAGGPGRTGEQTQALHALLRHLVAVCRLTQYAHDRGVLHRDIKPQNVLCGRYGETVVIDWGMAVPIKRDAAAARERWGAGSGWVFCSQLAPAEEIAGGSGSVSGTYAYMSPEQACAGRLTPATDVFLLGSTLYHILAGHPPFRPKDPHNDVLTGRFVPPRQVEPDGERVPKALDAVCRKAMSSRPDGRYASAEELADDLDRYLSDRGVRAHPDSRFAELARLARRHRGAAVAGVAAAAAVLVVAVGAAVFMTLAAGRADDARALAETRRREAVTARVAAEEARARAVGAGATARAQGALAVASSRESLRMSAALAAASVGHLLDERWDALETVAGDRRVVEPLREVAAADVADVRAALGTLETTGGVPTSNAPAAADLPPAAGPLGDLQAALGTLKGRWNDLATIVALTPAGLNVAKAPYPKPTERNNLGTSFAYRDYVHGLGRDLAAGSELPAEAAVNRGRHCSIPYVSTFDDRLRVTLTVPVFDGRRLVGRVSTSLLVSAFTELDDLAGLSAGGRKLVLVNTGPDQIGTPAGGEPHVGLILHHPDEHPGAFTNADRPAARVDDATLAEFARAGTGGGLIEGYDEPHDRAATLWDAAFHRVAAPGGDRTGDPARNGTEGWVLMTLQAAAP